MSSKVSQVCGEPKIFVGQIPLETSKDEILEVFSAFGAIKNVSIMSTPEGRSKGCAMILYEKWSQAEVAIEACHGKSFFGTNRALVVNLADPPRRGGGVPAIAPKTLFVGQVPKTTEDDEVRKLFEPFGEVLESHVSRKGSVSGCAFVKFNLWSEAESAMEALHGRHTLPGAKNPLVVKFADAKAKDHHPITSITNSSSLLPLGLKQHHPLLDSDCQGGTKLAFQSSVSGTGFSFNENLGAGSWQQSPGPLAAAVHPYQSLSRGLGFNLNSPTNGHPPPSVYGMNGSPYFSAFGNGTRAPPPPYSTSSAYASTMLVGGASTQPAPPPGILNTSMGGIMSVATTTSGSDFNLSIPKESVIQTTTVPSLDSKVDLNNGGAKLGPGISDPRANEWKLFVGQVPFECTEQDLWPIFSECGEILELVILRSEGRSKGCAFVTYSDKETAEAAANRLNGQVTVPNDRRGKRLVVRFAEKKKEINWTAFTEDIKTE